jgi:Carboxypeptidase regulatory-like domain
MSRVDGAVAVAAMVVLLATGCSARSLDEVSGTVLDGRAGQPIARAKVAATAPETPTLATSSDAQGNFTLQEVSKTARLQVTAPNYKPADVPVAEQALSFRLEPIPGEGLVTSTLANRALAANLGGKLHAGGRLRLRAKADGSFPSLRTGAG